jgi:DNA-binding MarR family transcriptional regulator
MTCNLEDGMERPIGYWLKEVDRLIEESFGRLLAEDGLTRRHWQVLNTVSTGPTATADLDRALAPFEPTVAPVLDDLAGRGWVEDTAGVVELTEAGRAAHASVRDRVLANRQALTRGISDAEYATVVRLLERMAGNLAIAQ